MFYGILNKKNLDKVMSKLRLECLRCYIRDTLFNIKVPVTISVGYFFPVQAIDILFHESFGYSLHQNVLPFAEQ